MSITPDIDGFRAAQRRLREGLGATAAFLIPQPTTWDPAEPIDPETGRPMDAFAEPVSGGGYDEILKRVSFVARPLTSGRALGGDSVAAPIGRIDMGTAAVIVDLADYPDVAAADRVRVAETVYDVIEWRHDTLGQAERWICYLEKA